MNTIRFLIACCLCGLVSAAPAYEHEESLVEFVEYAEDVITRNRHLDKPYFVLFSAEWCHWCHEFAEKTLVRQDVADYLNQNFINVFVDTDIHNSAYVKYRATGLPYTVFLNPDGSLYYQYTGTLYGDNFIEVLKGVVAEAGVGKYALGMESSRISYTPPGAADDDELAALPGLFTEGVLDNFDASESGLGKGQKAILPRTFLYLLDHPELQRQSVDSIGKTLERAIERIYDPMAGGFYRYAETRNWQIPHYEKFADLNAAAVLLLYRVDAITPSPRLKQAADKTLDYLMTTLFDEETGTFLSFQIADTWYYSLSQSKRQNARAPRVMDKVFTDRLAMTLDYLLEVIDLTQNRELEHKVRRSLDFLAAMIDRGGGLYRYYSLTDRQWLVPSGMSDHAYLAKLFADAARLLNDSAYAERAAKVLRSAITSYYDLERGIFVDARVDDSNNVEYLMEMNGLFAQAIIALGERLDGRAVVELSVGYFSLMGEPLEERLWNAHSWEFTEAYVPLLRAVDGLAATR